MTFCFISSFFPPTLQMKNSARNTSALNPVTTNGILILMKLNTHPDYRLLGSEQLHFQVCSTLYTELQTKNSMRRASAINPEIMDISQSSQLALKPSHINANQHLQRSGERNRTQGRQRCVTEAKVSKYHVHHM